MLDNIKHNINYFINNEDFILSISIILIIISVLIFVFISIFFPIVFIIAMSILIMYNIYKFLTTKFE